MRSAIGDLRSAIGDLRCAIADRRAARAFVGGGLAALALTIGCTARAGGVVVKSADVRLNLLLDGSLEVRETLTIRTGPGVTTFVRDVPGDRVDDFIDISAWIGNRRLVEGEGPGHVAISRGTSLRVRWQLAPSPDRDEVLTLQFRATGVLAIDGTHGVLRFDARPGGMGASIGPSHLELTAPSQSLFVTAPSIAAAGWAIERQGDRWIADKPSVGAAEPVVVTAALAADSLALAQPAWQFRSERASELMPAFAACGPFLLIVGAGVLLLLRAQYPAVRIAGQTAGLTADGPKLAPGLASAVAHDMRQSTWRMVQATASGLMARGVIQISETAGGVPGTRDFVVRLPADLQRHEQVVADEIWLGAKDGRVGVARAVRALRHLKSARFRRALVDDLCDAGLADRERETAARGLRISGWVLIAVGIVAAALSPLVLDAFGPWLLVIPASVVVVGAWFIVSARRLSILTEAGQRARGDAAERAAELALMERALERLA